jgi:hypothetical protein
MTDLGAKQPFSIGKAAARLLWRGEHVCRWEDTQVAPEDAEVIGELLVRGGMLLEDRSPEFISRLPPDERAVAARIELLRKTGAELLALAAAAACILDRPAE